VSRTEEWSQRGFVLTERMDGRCACIGGSGLEKELLKGFSVTSFASFLVSFAHQLASEALARDVAGEHQAREHK